jgi:heparin binding hemagglutinin HbhA
MSTQSANTRRIPNPLYAAAGAGDLAYRQLRQLPAMAGELRGRVIALRPVVTDAVTEAVNGVAGAVKEPGRRVDVDRLRVIARRNAALLVSQAQAAQERAATVYAVLVARGEKVVGGPYKELEPAGDVVALDYEPDDAPSSRTTSAAASSGPGTGKSRAKAVKRTVPTAVK